MNEIARRLGKDHERLEGLLKRLSDDAEGNDWRALQQTWGEFESCLASHLEAEERYLLPLIEGAHLADAEACRAEHGRIRSFVAELGVELDLHAVRKEAVEQFIEFLRDHSRRESSTLYRWGGDTASSDVERRVAGMLRPDKATLASTDGAPAATA